MGRAGGGYDVREPDSESLRHDQDMRGLVERVADLRARLESDRRHVT